LKPIDDQPVWSLVCFFVAKQFRGQGVARQLLSGAIEYAVNQGARIIEAYPTIPKSDNLPPVSSFMGVPSLFAQAGFIEIARPSQARMIMRYYIAA
jgi:GNAT superfamily N-acetyltransferase